MKYWAHDTCANCGDPIAGEYKYSCLQCVGYELCKPCFDSADCGVSGDHDHSHLMALFVCTDTGLPYTYKSSKHEHSLSVVWSAPEGTACDSCGGAVEGTLFTCSQCEGFAICRVCLAQTVSGDSVSARKLLEQLDTAKKGDQQERSEAIVAAVKEMLDHRHDLQRYPKSPYAGSYGCDKCNEEFTGVVYHCEDCGSYDLCPACYTPEVKKEQENSKLKAKLDVVNLLNTVQTPADKFETREPGKDDEIHYALSCEGCKVENVIGPLYKCLVCDVVLCGPCLDANSAPFMKIKHHVNHPMERRRAPNVMNNPATIPHNVPCDGCDSPIIVGTRYRCVDCISNYNWCETCFKKKATTKEHDLFHSVQVLLDPGAAREMIKKECCICHSSQNYGAMLKCNVCVNYNICKTCFGSGLTTDYHKPIHSLSYVIVGQDGLARKKRPKVSETTLPTLIGDDDLKEVINACKAEVKGIIEKCNASNTKFTDEDFPTNNECLFHDPENPPEEWISPQQYLRITDTSNSPVLFSSGITPDDVDQGAVGTCYLLGDLSGIAMYPHLISQLFVEYDIAVGVYGLRFFINNKWDYVIIDDYIPCNENRRPLYGCCTDRNEIWVMLIEKAYAKLHGCYENINGGMERLAFSDLTGGVAQRVVIPENLTVHSDGTTGKRPPVNKRIIFTDDSLGGAQQAGFSSAAFGTWRGVMQTTTIDSVTISDIELVIAFAAGHVEGGGKNLTTKAEYILEGATDAVNQFVWFVLKEVIYLPTTRPQLLIFMGLYNGDTLTISGDWLSLNLEDTGKFVLAEDVEGNLTNRVGPFSSIWDIFNIKHKDHVLMSCSIDDVNAEIEEKTETGLLKNHAYSLMKFYRLEKDLLLVKLRNPHGRANWRGEWAKGGKEWTEERKKQVGDYVDRENGEFYVEFTTFLSLFNSIDMCRLFTDQWNFQMRECEFTPLLCGGDQYWLENPQIRIMPQERGKFVINVSQPDVKIYSGDDLYPIPIGFRIVYMPYPTDRVREATGTLVVGHVAADSQKSVSIEIELDALDNPYYIIPYTSEPGKHLPFQVAVYSTAEFEMSDMTYMEDPACHPIPSGPWKGTYCPVSLQENDENEEVTDISVQMFFDPPRQRINGVGTDELGKYFILGQFEPSGADGDYDLELQLTYLQMRSMEAPPEPYYIYGSFSKESQQFAGFYMINNGEESVNNQITLAPVPRITLPSGFYEGTLTLEEHGTLPLSMYSLIFKNNHIYGSEFSSEGEGLAWYSAYGEISPEDNSLTICQMEHRAQEFMMFGKIGEDNQSFSGRLRGVLGGTLVDGTFELAYSNDRTQELVPKMPEGNIITDPLAEWYFHHRIFEVLEYFGYQDISDGDKEDLKKEIIDLGVLKKHFLDRIERHAAPDGADDSADTTSLAWYTRKEMARFGRNEMSRFGRAEMARLGRKETARFGRNEMKRFGRNEMKRFGRNEMKRFGRNEMKRFGRNEMKRFGKKERDDQEYDKREIEFKAAATNTANLVTNEDFANDYLQQQVQELETQLQAEKQRSQSLELAVASLQKMQKQSSLKQLAASPKTPTTQRIAELEASLVREKERSKKYQQELAKSQDAMAKLQREREAMKSQQLSALAASSKVSYRNTSSKVDVTGGSKVILPKLPPKK